ncbi:MAG: large-conductance mechanosensitive channel protein MscL [Clostridia bacterium]|nr:large-conductance mechanosensitive channel protein MscL [Clostridia bacterium]
MKNFIQDFKDFALKGNILDMAVGVVIGGAFGKIVSSLVADIITPLISILTGKVMLTDLKWVIAPATAEHAETALTYGNFIQSIIDFFIIALSIFIVLRVIMNAQKKIEELKAKKEEEKAIEEAAVEQTELEVLKEIKELLEKKDQ